MLNWSGGILGYILYVPENPALCKPIGLTLSVLTRQILVTCFQDTNADSVVRVVSTLHSQQLLFLLTPLEETWMLGYVFSGKSKSGFPNPNPDLRIQKRILSVFGQIQKRIMNPENPLSGWILRIKSNSGFSRFTIWAFFWEGIWKKYFWQAVFRKNHGLNLCWWRLIKFEPYYSMFVIYSNYWTLTSHVFLYVCSVCLRRFFFQVKKNNSSASILNSHNFTILWSVSYLRNVCVSNRNIYISYIHS